MKATFNSEASALLVQPNSGNFEIEEEEVGRRGEATEFGLSDPDREVRILHVTTVPVTAWNFVRPIAQRQCAQGWRVEIACSDGEYLDDLEESGLLVRRIDFSRNPVAACNVRAAFQLSQLLKDSRYDVVHTHSPVASFIGRIVAGRHKVPVVIYHMRGSWWDSRFPGASLFFTAAEKLAGKYTDHFFTINCVDRADLIRYNISRPEAVTCLHCGAIGVDIKEYDDEAARSVRAEFGIERNRIVFGFAGRVVEEKGIFDLIEAFRIVASLLPSSLLLIVGGVLESERHKGADVQLGKLIMRHGLSERVIRTGFREDMPALLSAIDLLVLPSRREAFGTVIAEAAVVGTPAIATKTRGTEEAIVDGESGLLVPLRDIRALSQAMVRLAETPEEIARLGANAKKLAAKRFDRDVVYDRMNAIYKTLLTNVEL